MFNFLSKLTNLQQRLIVGVAGAAVIISGICVNQWTYLITFFLICFFSLLEIHSILNLNGIGTNKWIGVFIGLCLFLVSFAISAGLIDTSSYKFVFALLFCLFLVELFQQNEKPFERTAFSILAIVYTALPYAFLNHIVFKSGTYNFKIILGIIFLLWANDTGGYFGGRFLGKHKLYERISPKKTWEGSISGALFSLGIAYALYYYLQEFTLPFWLGLSMVVVVAGSLGDLVESQFKRSLQIKDSGTSLPGHGGFLDRFDGLIIALPFLLVYFELF